MHNNETKKIVYSLTTTPISKLITDPRNYEGKRVSVHGTVEKSFNPGIDYYIFSFNLGVKFYTLNDGTGTITVFTEKAVPKVGEVVRVRGIFNQRVRIGQFHFETITER